jgi:hypothetical protein
MQDWDINHHLFKILMKIILKISTMMHETWINIENCQTVTIFRVDHNLLTPTRLESEHGSNKFKPWRM